MLQQRKEPVYKVKAKSSSVSGTASQLGLLWEWTKDPVVSIQEGYQVSFQPSISRLPDWSYLLESSLNWSQGTALEELPAALSTSVSCGSAVPPQKQPAQEGSKQTGICWQHNTSVYFWCGLEKKKKRYLQVVFLNVFFILLVLPARPHPDMAWQTPIILSITDLLASSNNGVFT